MDYFSYDVDKAVAFLHGSDKLQEMGVPPEAAEKALLEADNNVQAATEKLFGV
jgi:hypothetical protein